MKSSPGVSDILVGLDYGDEGKGRFIDIMLESGKYQIVARFNGGNNAGHTLITPDGKKIVLNSIPSGILYPEIVNYIGSGCVVNPRHLIDSELPKVRPYMKSSDQLKISSLASAITPIHILWDKLSGALVGTTGNGIGPAYADKARRAEGSTLRNLRLADILQNPAKAESTLLKQYIELISLLGLPENREMLIAYCQKNKIQWEKLRQHSLIEAIAAQLNMPSQIEQFLSATRELNRLGFIEKNDLWITDQVENGKNVLMEGAQAYGLDVNYGQTPFTTSSTTFAGGAYTGADLSPKYHGKITGVSKAVSSRVGSGPFVGELGGEFSEEYCGAKDENGGPLHNQLEESVYNLEDLFASEELFKLGIAIRRRSGEYGATTQRPRRISMMDLVRIQHAARKSGIDNLIITKVDDLPLYGKSKKFEGQIPLITRYKLGQNYIDYVPATAEELYQIKPEITLTPSFGDISKARQHSDLAPEVLAFVELVQTQTKTRISAIGVGPGRHEVVNF